jgi:cysteine synthase A
MRGVFQPLPFVPLFSVAANPAHFYHQAARIAAETPGAVFLNQFENDANFRAHYTGTGPEIWHQLGRKLDAFVCAMGTGGTMAGCSTYLREQNPMIVRDVSAALVVGT